MNNDVLFEILLHLPVRSLLRFICVCKFWYYTIDSPHFKYLHTLRLDNKKDEETSPSGGTGFQRRLQSGAAAVVLGASCLHANLYLAMTNSWSKLDLDQNLVIKEPIKSVCKNGSFAHWEGRNSSGKKIILSFDMKNELFRTITIPCDSVLGHSAILAKGECSFVIFVRDSWKLKIYELSCEGSELIWNNVNNVELHFLSAAPPISRIDDIPIRRNDNCVVLRGLPIWSDYIPIRRNYSSVVLRGCKSSEVILYDYRARKLIGRFKMCGSSDTIDDIIEYEGSFLPP